MNGYRVEARIASWRADSESEREESENEITRGYRKEDIVDAEKAISHATEQLGSFVSRAEPKPRGRVKWGRMIDWVHRVGKIEGRWPLVSLVAYLAGTFRAVQAAPRASRC